MTVLLILGSIIPIVILGYYISKIDKYINEGGIDINDDNSKMHTICPVAIVLGESNLAIQIYEILKGNNIQIFHLTEPFLLEKGLNFKYLFAMSNNDTDNLILYKIAQKIYNIEGMISLCNDTRNEDMFIREKIHYTSGEHITALMIYQKVMKLAGVDE